MSGGGATAGGPVLRKRPHLQARFEHFRSALQPVPLGVHLLHRTASGGVGGVGGGSVTMSMCRNRTFINSSTLLDRNK
jgi:hypothetical protein